MGLLNVHDHKGDSDGRNKADDNRSVYLVLVTEDGNHNYSHIQNIFYGGYIYPGNNLIIFSYIEADLGNGSYDLESCKDNNTNEGALKNTSISSGGKPGYSLYI